MTEEISIKIDEIKNPKMRAYLKRKYYQNKKTLRKQNDKYILRRCKKFKQDIRAWQKEHNGQRPPIDQIPPGFYCYTLIDGTIPGGGDHICDPENIVSKRHVCPFYYQVQVPEDQQEECEALVAVGQTWYGGCTLIRQTDLDFGGNGLLWDMCKECGLKDGSRACDYKTRSRSIYEACRR